MADGNGKPAKRAKKAADSKAVTRDALQYFSVTVNAPEAKRPETLPCHELLIKFLDERGWRYVFQHERGAETARDHYQCRLDLGSKAQRKTVQGVLNLFEAGGYVRQLVTVRPESNNSLATRGLEFYCMKPERVAGPWFDQTYTPPIKRAGYRGEDLVAIDQQFLPWQATVFGWLSERSMVGRTIRWIFNPSGKAGKSLFQKWAEFRHAGDIELVASGNAHQIKASVIDRAMQLGGGANAYMINLPRTSGREEHMQDLYSAIEAILDGNLRTSMHGNCRSLKMNPPQVVVFANEVPANIHHMSVDRWNIYYLEDMDSELVRMSLDTVQFERRLDRLGTRDRVKTVEKFADIGESLVYGDLGRYHEWEKAQRQGAEGEE